MRLPVLIVLLSRRDSGGEGAPKMAPGEPTFTWARRMTQVPVQFRPPALQPQQSDFIYFSRVFTLNRAQVKRRLTHCDTLTARTSGLIFCASSPHTHTLTRRIAERTTCIEPLVSLPSPPVSDSNSGSIQNRTPVWSRARV